MTGQFASEYPPGAARQGDAGGVANRGSAETWWTPGVFEVTADVYRIPLPLGNDALRAVNVYALTSSDGVVLIDSGWAIPEARESLDAALEKLGYSPSDIKRILVTHVHRDHYTQAVRLRREFRIPISLGSGELPSLEVAMRTDGTPLAPQLNLLRALGAGELADAVLRGLARETTTRPDDWEMPDHWLQPGQLSTETGTTLEVVATPGHTRGHVVFHDIEAGLLFSGDHVLSTITPSIGFEPAPGDNPLCAFLGSLARLRQRPDALLLPAHGPVTASAHRRIDELLAHHTDRLSRVEAGVARGATTAFEVAALLTWTRRSKKLSELDPFNQMLAIAETDAHLRLLAAQGRLVATPDGGIQTFRCP